MTEAVDLVVDRRVLLDVGVGRREVGLGLVVVVVGDEELDPVLREELPQLRGELGGQRLVGLDDQGRALDLLDRPGDRGGLPAPGDALEGLVPVATLHPVDQGGDRRRLVTGGLEGGDDLEGGHLGDGTGRLCRVLLAYDPSAARRSPIQRHSRPTSASRCSSDEELSRTKSARPRRSSRPIWAPILASASALVHAAGADQPLDRDLGRAVDHHHRGVAEPVAVRRGAAAGSRTRPPCPSGPAPRSAPASAPPRAATRSR